MFINKGKPWGSAGNFSFVLSTSSPYTAVAAVDCATCVAQVGQAPVYVPLSLCPSYRSSHLLIPFKVRYIKIFFCISPKH